MLRSLSSSIVEVGPGIFYCDASLVTADRRTTDFLKDVARSTPVRRARLCAHPRPEADQHDMLIVSHRDTYVAPHRHRNKSETMLVIEGRADAHLYSEAGDVERLLRMGPLGSGRTFFYRMPPNRFHGLRIVSELLVFVESTKGPFRAEDTENAPWAPAPEDAEAGHAFVADAFSRSTRLEPDVEDKP